MDRRTLLFVVISVLILVVYQEFILKQITPSAPPPVPFEVSEPMSGAPDRPGAKPDAPVSSPPASELADERAEAPIEGQRITVETDLYEAVFSTAGGRIESFTLKRYRQTDAPDSPPLTLVAPAPELELPLGVELRGARTWSDSRTAYVADQSALALQGNDSGPLVLRGEIAGKPIVKTLTFQANAYTIDLDVSVPAGAELPTELTQAGPAGDGASVALVMARRLPVEQSSTSFEGAAAVIDGKLQQYALADVTETQVVPGEVAWAGFEDHYFLSPRLAPGRRHGGPLRRARNHLETKILTPREGDGAGRGRATRSTSAQGLNSLEAAGHDLERALNLGWFGPISLSCCAS